MLDTALLDVPVEPGERWLRLDREGRLLPAERVVGEPGEERPRELEVVRRVDRQAHVRQLASALHVVHAEAPGVAAQEEGHVLALLGRRRLAPRRREGGRAHGLDTRAQRKAARGAGDREVGAA